MNNKKEHPIRSFVKRQRQLGQVKQQIFDKLWPTYKLDISMAHIVPEQIFGRNAPLNLEIGFGNGETLFALAQQYPEQDFIGIEVYTPGIAHLLELMNQQPLDNIRIYNEDAVTVLHQCIPDATLDNVLILFPDPWPKKRHHKRRLIQTKFIELLHHKLKSRGILNVATDWANYADHINGVMANNRAFTVPDHSLLLPCIHNRTITTKFEQRGKNKGHDNFDMLFIKNE